MQWELQQRENITNRSYKLKHTIAELKNTLEESNNRWDAGNNSRTGQWSSIRAEKEKKNEKKSKAHLKDLRNNSQGTNICMRHPRKEKG